MIFGGSDAPCALATLTSLGSINKANNESLSAELASVLGEFGVESNRYYLNCFDVPRENCGYKGATFAS
jgi:Macrophage migration inhibitory factor (MIF)